MINKDNDINEFIEYENGNMDDKDAIQFFQKLIDSGWAWQLQGHYGRTADMLIEHGLCEAKKDNSVDVDPFDIPAIKQEDEW
jgi:hypothetical protein